MLPKGAMPVVGQPMSGKQTQMPVHAWDPSQKRSAVLEVDQDQQRAESMPLFFVRQEASLRQPGLLQAA